MVIDFDKEFKMLLIQQDEPTFNDFYLQTVDIFYRYMKANCSIDEADIHDIIAEAYVKLRNALPNYDINQNFSWYIWAIFKNHIKDFWKKSSLVAFSSIWEIDQEGQKTDFGETIADPENFMDLLEWEYKFEQIKTAINHLDEVSQDILFLRFTEERDYAFIASTCDISQESARQKCSRAIKQLKQLLWEN